MHVQRSLVLATFVGALSVAGCTMAPKPVIVKCTMEGDQIDVVSFEPARGRRSIHGRAMVCCYPKRPIYSQFSVS